MRGIIYAKDATLMERGVPWARLRDFSIAVRLKMDMSALHSAIGKLMWCDGIVPLPTNQENGTLSTHSMIVEPPTIEYEPTQVSGLHFVKQQGRELFNDGVGTTTPVSRQG